MNDFIHPDLLRTVNYGGNREAEDRFFARIERETKEVEDLRKQGLQTHEAWMLVRMQRGLVN